MYLLCFVAVDDDFLDIENESRPFINNEDILQPPQISSEFRNGATALVNIQLAINDG